MLPRAGGVLRTADDALVVAIQAPAAEHGRPVMQGHDDGPARRLGVHRMDEVHVALAGVGPRRLDGQLVVLLLQYPAVAALLEARRLGQLVPITPAHGR